MGAGRRFGDWAAWRAESLLWEGSAAALAGAGPTMGAACAALDDCVESHGWQEVAAAAGSVFCCIVCSLLEGGWAPREVVHQVRRHRGVHHADLVAAAMGARETWGLAGDAPPPEAWAVQLAELGVDRCRQGPDWLLDWLAERAPRLGAAWPVVLEALGVLRRLPPIEPLLPRPSEWASLSSPAPDRSADQAVLAKVRALLAKAESTNLAAEADALMAKAQELMPRSPAAAARAPAHGVDGGGPAAVRVLVEEPWAATKAQLLGAIAGAHGVRSAWCHDLAMTALAGARPDVDAVETLFTSLLVQATRGMLEHDGLAAGGGRAMTRSFRQSFLAAFAEGIGERVAVEAPPVGRRSAEDDPGDLLPPAGAGRRREADEAGNRQFPHLGPPAVTIANQAGWRAGRAAAEAASLDSDVVVLEAARA